MHILMILCAILPSKYDSLNRQVYERCLLGVYAHICRVMILCVTLSCFLGVLDTFGKHAILRRLWTCLYTTLIYERCVRWFVPLLIPNGISAFSCRRHVTFHRCAYVVVPVIIATSPIIMATIIRRILFYSILLRCGMWHRYAIIHAFLRMSHMFGLLRLGDVHWRIYVHSTCRM